MAGIDIIGPIDELPEVASPPALNLGNTLRAAVAPPAAPIPRPPVGVPTPSLPVPMGMPGMPAFVPTETRIKSTSRSRVEPTKNEGTLWEQLEATQKKAEELAQKQIAIKIGMAKAQEQAAVTMEAESAARRDQAQAVMAAGEDRLKRDQSEYQIAKDKFKSQGYQGFWADKNDGRRVMASISIALGGIGDALLARAGMRGDYAKQIVGRIENAIEHDWQVYKTKLDTQERALERAGVRLDRDEDRMERLRTARADAGIEHAQAITRRMLAAQGVPAAEIDANVIVNQLEQSRVALQLRREEGLRDRVNAQTQDTVQKVTSAQTAGYGIRGPGGAVVASTGDPKKDAEISERVEDFRTLRSALAELRDSYVQHGREIPGSPEAQRRESLASQSQVLFNKLAKLGALSGPDLGIIQGVVGKGSAVYVRDPVPRFDQALRSLDGTMAKGLDRYGLPGQQLVPKLQDAAPNPAAVQPPAGGGGGKRETRKLRDGRIVSGTLMPDGNFVEDGP